MPKLLIEVYRPLPGESLWFGTTEGLAGRPGPNGPANGAADDAADAPRKLPKARSAIRKPPTPDR